MPAEQVNSILEKGRAAPKGLLEVLSEQVSAILYRGAQRFEPSLTRHLFEVYPSVMEDYVALLAGYGFKHITYRGRDSEHLLLRQNQIKQQRVLWVIAKL